MSEQVQPKVGDRVRLTMVIEGVAEDSPYAGLSVGSYPLDSPNYTVEILPEPLPSEPNTYWLGCVGDVWRVRADGVLHCLTVGNAEASASAPFHQLVLKKVAP
jgi:hypothetical protein